MDPADDAVPAPDDRCRTCGGGGLRGDGVRCAACGGAWLAELALLDLVADATQAPMGRLPWVAGAPAAARACETCSGAMQPVALYGIPLDRCAGHGVWLDGDELERVLHEAPLRQRPFVPPTGQPRSLTDGRGEVIGNILLGDPLSYDQAGRDGVLGAIFKLLD